MLTAEQQIIELIKKSKNLLITFNKSWNGDSVSSALAMFLFIKKLGKNVDLIADKFDQGMIYSFLPAYKEIKYTFDNLRKFIISLNLGQTKINQIKYKIEENTLDFFISPRDGFFTDKDICTRATDFKYDTVITLDTPDLESLGKTYEAETDFFYRTPIINIDHHSNNESFGQINYVQLTAVSTSEILFYLFDIFSRELIDEDIATCLLAGMIAETKSFKTTNITPQTLSTAAQLIALGGRREEIVNRFYRSRSLNLLKLWGRTLARLSGTCNNQLIYSMLSQNDFIKTNLTEFDLNEVIDEMIVNIPQAQIIIIFCEAGNITSPKTNVVTYSTKNLDTLSLTKEYGSVGIRNMAKFFIYLSLEETRNKIIPEIENKIMKLL